MTWNIFKTLREIFRKESQNSPATEKQQTPIAEFYKNPTVVVKINSFGTHADVHIQEGYFIINGLDIFDFIAKSLIEIPHSVSNTKEVIFHYEGDEKLCDNVKIKAEIWARQNGYGFTCADERWPDPYFDPYIPSPENNPLS